jgi:hypothetical protein
LGRSIKNDTIKNPKYKSDPKFKEKADKEIYRYSIAGMASKVLNKINNPKEKGECTFEWPHEK